MKARTLLAAICLSLLILAVLAGPAQGWSIGSPENGYLGTHGWILDQAYVMAGSPPWLDLQAAKSTLDDPDTVYKDFYFHYYDRWGIPFGDAPTMVAYRFTLTKTLLKNGDNLGASRQLGLLAHYFQDITQPLHTDLTLAQAPVHSAYETAVNGLLDGITITGDGFAPVTAPRAHAVSAAAFAHTYYNQVIYLYSKYGIGNAQLQGITNVCLQRAVNDLADYIATLEGAAS